MTPREGIGQIPDYEKKLSILIKRQNGCCAIAAAHGEFAEPTELHHARIINDKWSRMKFPLFIHSLVNLMGIGLRGRSLGSNKECVQTKIFLPDGVQARRV